MSPPRDVKKVGRIPNGFSRLAYTEALDDEKTSTTIGFFHRGRAIFAAHGITRITRLATDNGANYTEAACRAIDRSVGQKIMAHLIEAIALALGFRNQAHYRLRSLLEAGGHRGSPR